MQNRTHNNAGFTLVEIMIVVSIIGLLTALVIPNFMKARDRAQLNSILNNLRIIEGAKAQWALENKKSEGSPATEQDLAQYLRGGKINPVAGETYHINPVGTPPTATLSQQIMNHPAGSVIKAQ